MSDYFLKIPFTIDNLDRFYVRSSIKKALVSQMPQFSGKFLDIGCGKMPYKQFILENSTVREYIGLDIETAIEYDVNVKPDFTWGGITMPFENNTFDTTFATEVLEHCP